MGIGLFHDRELDCDTEIEGTEVEGWRLVKLEIELGLLKRNYDMIWSLRFPIYVSDLQYVSL